MPGPVSLAQVGDFARDMFMNAAGLQVRDDGPLPQWLTENSFRGGLKLS